MEDDWNSEDLHSVFESEDFGTLRVRSKCFQYHEEDLREDFKFKVGMKFISLQQFKDIVREHSVLNGRRISCKKNDGIRCRVVCKRKCDFVMLCCKVGGNHTFSINTLRGPHTCGRGFNNKNATSRGLLLRWLTRSELQGRLNLMRFSKKSG